MTLQIDERITVEELVKGLQTLSFDEVTEDSVTKVFPNNYLNYVTDIDEDTKDIDMDDYIFTVHRYKEDEGICTGFKVNDTTYLSTIVEVYLPCKDVNSFVQADGEIFKGVDGRLRMEINFLTD